MNAPMHPPGPPGPPGPPPTPEPPPIADVIDRMRETIETQARTIRYLLSNYQGLLDKVEGEEEREEDGGGGGVDYSTTETATGRKWVDGKPIYQKTVELTQAAAVTPYGASSSSFPHGISGPDTFVDVEFSWNRTLAFWDGTNNNLKWGGALPHQSATAWIQQLGNNSWTVDDTYLTFGSTVPPGYWDNSTFGPPLVGTAKPPKLFVTFRYTKA